jgi:dTDP-glucose 4,6-dehydratase
MNTLITGGAGFIGSNLVHYLLGHSVHEPPLSVNRLVNFDKLTYAGNPSNLSLVSKDPRHCLVVEDITDSQAVARTLEEFDIDIVMHLAAESHVDRSIDGPEKFIHTNVLGTFCLLDQFHKWLTYSKKALHPKYGKPLSQGGNCAFLHVSTDEVYGSLMTTDPPFCETTAYAPNSPYSASKAGSDHLARAWHHTYGLPVITTNCSNNYGPFQFPEKLLPLIIRRAMRNEKLPVYGDGSNVRDWLYVTDHCQALAMAAAKGQPGETYTIGGQEERTNLQVVRCIVETLRRLIPNNKILPPEDLISFVTDRPGHDHRYAIDPTRIQSELGWRPCETFESGIEKTVQWYLNHQDWIQEIEDLNYQGERLGTIAA